MSRLSPILLLMLTALGACATTPSASADPAAAPRFTTSEQRGHDLAVRRCAGCHTVGQDDGGASEGPSFRSLSVRYNPISLERRFSEVSAHGVDRMPPVGFTTSEAEDLAAYMTTLSRR